MVIQTVGWLLLRGLVGLVGLGRGMDAKNVEIAVLRHQLAVLHRQVTIHPTGAANAETRLVSPITSAIEQLLQLLARSRTGLPLACSFDRRPSTPDMIEQATSIYRNGMTASESRRIS